MQKSGWKTTEFWMALGVNVIALLAAIGIFEPNQLEGLQQAWVSAIAGLAALVNNAIYIWSRTRVKQKSAEEK